MILQIESVTKKFGGLTALDSVDLAVEEGEILGVIGPNGAGKSTLLNLIAGVYKPTTGTIRFRGERISGLSPYRICRQGIARTFQIPKPFVKMSALENVLVAASFGDPISNTNPAASALEMLDFVGFASAPETPAASLNTAQLRRLDLARALASKPKLLLLDESAAGLTPNELADLQTLIRSIRNQGVTFLIVEHLMRLIMELCDRIIVLHYGEKIAEGTPSEICEDKQVAKAYLGEEYLLA
jgi:branched-chain amino acid transport system ATP-binding protein